MMSAIERAGRPSSSSSMGAGMAGAFGSITVTVLLWITTYSQPSPASWQRPATWRSRRTNAPRQPGGSGDPGQASRMNDA
eukprot:3661106-Rhodomonas_salina.1